MKKFISLISLILLFSANTFAFGIIQFDFAEISSNNILSFNAFNSKVITNEITKNILKVNSVKTNSTNQITKPKNVKPELKIILADVSYTQNDLKVMMGNNKMKTYVKAFGYDCIYINTDKNADFTLFFDVETGSLEKVQKGDNCDNKIYIEESLIVDIRQNGFSASNIKDYLKKIDLPTSMYFKAIKVFTVG